MMHSSHATQQIPIDDAPEIHAVHSLMMHHFRNHAAAELHTEGKSVVIHGPNGAGKTNILEAISLLAPGRGFRRARLPEMDMQGSSTRESWVISAHVYSKIGSMHIGTGRERLPLPLGKGRGEGMFSTMGSSHSSASISFGAPGPYPNPLPEGEGTQRRVVRVGGTALKSPNQLAEYLSIVWLTPQMDMLFLEGGTARRKFLDRLVYGFDASHATRVNRYELAMRERNRLLAMPCADGDWLLGVEQQMVEQGIAIAYAREQAVQHMNQVMRESTLDFPKAHLALNGSVEDSIAQGAPAIDVERAFASLLCNSRREDARAGRTLTGIHRATFTVTHTQKNMEAAHCSTGEQKALLLAIILAEARSCRLWHGHVPILLLDEVAAHLDPQKRKELYKELQDLKAQVWMTGVSCDLFEEMHDNSVFFRVEQGEIFRDA